jgi:hypothetical protein
MVEDAGLALCQIFPPAFWRIRTCGMFGNERTDCVARRGAVDSCDVIIFSFEVLEELCPALAAEEFWLGY